MQGVSTARSRGSDGTEAALKSCNSMSEIRKEATLSMSNTTKKDVMKAKKF